MHHLMPGAGEQARRQHELSSIAAWIDDHDEVERDFVILGDMNIEDAAELADVTPPGFVSLNDECRPTNTNVNSPKPYDHVMVSPVFTTEMDWVFDLQVITLIEAMRGSWNSTDPYPGDPYVHNTFRQYYSDYHPVVFRLAGVGVDDD
jgi:hypothetical protein